MVLTFETFDEEYVRRLREGDPGAGDHFAAYFGNLLYSKLRMRLRSSHLAEDVKQETLMRVLLILRSGSGVRRPERFGAFVNGVCENVIRELCRLDKHDEPLDEQKMDEPLDTSVDLDADLVNADLKREIRRTFLALPDKDRRILQAIFLDEIDRVEVCRIFNVDAAYLRVLVHRAKEHFRNLYGAQDHLPSPFNPYVE